MTIRILKVLTFLLAIITLSLLRPSNGFFTQTQTATWMVSSTASKQMSTALASYSVKLGVLSSTNSFTFPHTTEKMSELDGSGNGNGAISSKLSGAVKAGTTTTLVFSCDSPVSGNAGLTWDGNYLWIADWTTRRVIVQSPMSFPHVFSGNPPATYLDSRLMHAGMT